MFPEVMAVSLTRYQHCSQADGAVSPTNSAPDFTDAEFQNDDALGALGYTLIGTVSTPMVSGGQVGVSIAGEIGTYRYISFDMAPPVWGVGPRPTFFGEIDILGAPPAAPFRLTLTPAAEPGSGYVLEWESLAGELYSLRASTDLGEPFLAWELVEGDIEATPPVNTYPIDPAGPRRFYAVEQSDAPPPPLLISADVEGDDGGFTVLTP